MLSTPEPRPFTEEDAARLQRGINVRLIGVAVGIVWVASLFMTLATDDNAGDRNTVIRPVESYDSDDLARAADALEALRGTRLTPSERSAVGVAADVIGEVANGNATIGPSEEDGAGEFGLAATPTAAAPATPPPAPSTTTAPTTTTTTEPPTTTTRPRRTYEQMVADLAADAGVDLPDGGG